MKSPTKKTRAREEFSQILRRQMEEGSLKAGDHLLPAHELMERYQISARAVREGLAVLEAQGWIQRHRGRSAIVLPRGKAKKPTSSKNVAVIFLGRVRDLATAEYFDSLQQSFQREGFGTSLYVTDLKPEKEVKIVNQLVKDGVPGIVLFSAHSSNSFAHLEAAQEAGTKLALFDHYFPGFQTNFVGIDDQAGGYEAVEHLIRLGCEELVFINWDRDWSTHTLRQRGFEMAVTKWGLPAHVLKLPGYENVGTFEKELRREMAPILARGQRRLGVVAFNDVAAVLAMDCLRNEGWSVPEDAAVIGFANELDGALAEIPLTTMEIPREDIARAVAHLVIDQIRDPRLEPQQIQFHARLVLRESCGCYPPQNQFPRRPHLKGRADQAH